MRYNFPYYYKPWTLQWLIPLNTTINVLMNYVEFDSIVIGLESKKFQEKNHVFAKIKKTIYFSYLILTLWMTFITNIQ